MSKKNSAIKQNIIQVILIVFSSKDVNKEKDAKPNLELILDYFFDLVAREMQLMNYYKEAEKILDLQIDGGIDN